MRQNQRPIPVVRVRLSDQELLRRFCTKPRKQIFKRQKKLKSLRRIRRCYTLDQHVIIVYLRHRSLTDFSQVWHRWCEISQRTGVLYTTCREIVERWTRRGLTKMYGSCRKPLPLPPEVTDYLRQNLYQHRFLSLQQRCDLVKTHFDFHITRKRLGANFKRMGIQYRPCKTVMKASLRGLSSRRSERQEFVQKLVSLMVQGKHVIFADETSINLWDKKRIHRTWQLEAEPIRHLVNTKRLSNITVYGAVSNKLPELQFMLGTSTESQQWKNFLRMLLAEVQERQMPKPYLVIDNHPVHKSSSVRDVYDHFHVLFLPSYSSHLNSQETIWSLFKRHQQSHLQYIRQEIKTQAEFKGHVEQVLSKMKAQYQPKRLFMAAREEFESLLEE